MSTIENTMHTGVHLRFFVHSHAKHHGIPVHEWLLELAHKKKLAGGSAYRAIAGFGRFGVLHDETFFELAGDLPVMVDFILKPEGAQALIDAVAEAGVELVYACSDVKFGVLKKSGE